MDDHLLRALKREAAERNVSFKAMVHQALQMGLQAMEQRPPSEQPYRTPTRSLRPKPGSDLDTLGRTADEQADDESMGRS